MTGVFAWIGEMTNRSLGCGAPYRVRRLFTLLLLAACAVFSGDRALSQTSGGPADLLQIFQTLPQEQQDAILKQLGAGGGGGGAGAMLNALTGGGGGGQAAAARRRPSAVTEQQAAEAPEEVEPPGLKAEDWVIIQATLPAAIAPPSAAPALPALPALPPAAAAAAPGGTAAGATQGSLANLLAATAGATPPASTGGGESADTAAAARERERLQPLIALIRSQNPYRLSREGALTLPGFAPIALLGLSDEQATLRLSIEPALRGIDIRLTSLPLRRTGAEGLKPFGYDIFGKQAPSFTTDTNVPVPSDYIIGPGDELNVQFYGNANRTLKLVVGRDGVVNLPDIGPVSVAGQRFLSVKSALEERVERQMVGTRASVSMGETRTIRVFVLGEAKRPGSYTISALGTITSALYAAGGVRQAGSLRNVMLMRGGTLVRRLDLYDLLIRGNTNDDAKLLQDDVVLIPAVGRTVGVVGEVRRPAIYEIKGESTVADLVQLAGGLTPDADRAAIVLTRIDEQQHRVVLSVDTSAGARSRSQLLRDDDLLTVPRLRPNLDSGILVQGYLYAPGSHAWRSGIRVSDVVHSVDELRPNADIHYVLIRRETPPNDRVSVLSVDLAAALEAPGSTADVPLMPRDRITVFDLESGRDRFIQPVLEELRLQASTAQPSQIVTVEGRVRVPGQYPLETGMTVRDLIRAGGGTTDAAYGGNAELIRSQIVNGEARRTELINIDLTAALRGDAAANVHLQSFDTLSVKEIPNWQTQESVTLRGEIRFPGNYTIRQGETLKSVLNRAGGLTQYAFPQGSVFTREELRRREQEQLDMLADRMQRDVALLALQAASANQTGAGTAFSVGQSLMLQIKGAKAVGRLVIDLPRLESNPAGSMYDVVLHGGDMLGVPRFEQQVTVIGEVQTATSHLYNPKLTRDDYINLSGGVTRRADSRKIYVVRANGSVVAAGGGGWFQLSRGETTIRPGDTIVVPLDTEHIPALPLWTQVTQIIYNLAVALLAIRSV
jgi:protein involved in polysaccharide export with SLBB domain